MGSLDQVLVPMLPASAFWVVPQLGAERGVQEAGLQAQRAPKEGGGDSALSGEQLRKP